MPTSSGLSTRSPSSVTRATARARSWPSSSGGTSGLGRPGRAAGGTRRDRAVRPNPRVARGGAGTHRTATTRSRAPSSEQETARLRSGRGEAPQRQARDQPVGDDQDRQVYQRSADPRAGGVERGGHRLQGWLEREKGSDDLDQVEDAAADGAGGDQREEGDRRGDHEGEQGDGTDLPRR